MSNDLSRESNKTQSEGLESVMEERKMRLFYHLTCSERIYL